MENTPTADEHEYTERLRSLLQIENILSDDFRAKLNEKAMRLLDGLTPDAKSFFNYDLDDSKHSEEDVRTVIRCIPSVLSLDYDTGESVLHRLTERTNSVPFIPVAVEEANHINYNDPALRGSLLWEADGTRESVIYELCIGEEPVHCDVIRRLREMRILRKADIQEQDLLFICNPELLEFFADWDPEALQVVSNRHDSTGTITVHHFTIEWHEGCYEDPETRKSSLTLFFKPLIKAGFRYYPDQLGLLMLTNDRSDTVWRKLNEKIGLQETWEIIEDSIHETSNDNVLVESDQNVSFSPLFMAAVSDLTADGLNILNHLLRQEPAQWNVYLD